jgi:hypothetical protein
VCAQNWAQEKEQQGKGEQRPADGIASA